MAWKGALKSEGGVKIEIIFTLYNQREGGEFQNVMTFSQSYTFITCMNYIIGVLIV